MNNMDHKEDAYELSFKDCVVGALANVVHSYAVCWEVVEKWSICIEHFTSE